jgi:hypothetical protein
MRKKQKEEKLWRLMQLEEDIKNGAILRRKPKYENTLRR